MTEADPHAATVAWSLARRLEAAEAASLRSFYGLAPEAEARKLGIAVERVADCTLLMVKGSRNLFYNRVLGFGLGDGADDADLLEEIVAAYAACRVKRFSLDLTPASRPHGALEAALRARGFTPKGFNARLLREDPPLPETACDLRIVEIGPERAADWFDVMRQVWPSLRSRGAWYAERVGAPGWRHYLAVDDADRPAAIGASYRDGETLRLTEAATQRDYRRRGAQAAIIARRVADGLEEGCRLFTSETAPPLPREPLVSYRNMERLGFRLAYLRQGWALEDLGS